MSGPAETGPAVIAPPDPANRPPRLRWRLFPTLGCGLFGGLIVVSAILGSNLVISRANRVAMPADMLGTFVLGVVLNATGGLLWVAAAVFWWGGRWGWAAGLSVLGFAFLTAASRFPL